MKRNAQLAAVFRAAEKRISPTNLCAENGQYIFICNAIHGRARTGNPHCAQAVQVIKQRIEPHRCLEDWLEANGVPPAQLKHGTGRHVQAHRRAWLLQLAAEFEGKQS